MILRALFPEYNSAECTKYYHDTLHRSACTDLCQAYSLGGKFEHAGLQFGRVFCPCNFYIMKDVVPNANASIYKGAGVLLSQREF